MLKLVGWFPIEQREKNPGTMLVRTGNESLLVCEQDGEILGSPYNADELRRKVIGHRAMLLRHAQDTKHEKRWPKEVRDRHHEDMQVRVTKHRNYSNTQLQLIARMVVNLAQRRRLGHIEYNDSERGFIPEWEYAALRLRIGHICDEEGIEFVVNAASGGVEITTPEPARDPEVTD